MLGSRVLTDSGTDLGQVTEVIVEIGATADVVGYEIDSSDALGPDRRRVLIPLPDVLAASAEALIVPAAAVDFVSDDLSGFGAAVAGVPGPAGRPPGQRHPAPRQVGPVRFSEAAGRTGSSPRRRRRRSAGSTLSSSTPPAGGGGAGAEEDRGRRRLLLWSALTAFGRDAVTVPDAEAFTIAEGPSPSCSARTHAMLRKRVLTEAGDDVGDGRGRGVRRRLRRGHRAADQHRGDRRCTGLLGVGSYAVVVRSAPSTG